MMNLDTEYFKTRLLNLCDYNEDYCNTFNQLLLTSEAVIAGGCVLGVYTDGHIHDIDIYVHLQKLCTLVDGLITLGCKFGRGRRDFIRPAYDRSFFVRNNLLARFMMWSPRPGFAKFIDIIVVHNDTPIRDVVTNFDLSFCEIWYDGERVEAVNPAGVVAKTGVLKRDYVDNLLTYLNKYTIKRIQKYVKRGFSITYETAESAHTILRTTKNVTNQEDWVVYKIYNHIVFNFYRSHQRNLVPWISDYINNHDYVDIEVRIFCKCSIQEYTLVNLRLVLGSLGVAEQDYIMIYKYILYREGYSYFPDRYKDYILEVLDITQANMAEYTIHQDAVERRERRREMRRSIMERERVNIEAFVFEEADDIDERNIPNVTCHDMITTEDVNMMEHLNNADTFLFINKSPTGEFDVFCFEKEYIITILSDKNSNWFYECTGPIIAGTNNRAMSTFGDTPYIKIPMNTEGLNGFIPLIQIQKLLSSVNKIFYIYPYLEDDGIQKMITHSVTWQNSFGPRENMNFVSANHCQSGSSILVYTLKLCRDPVRCVKSLFQPALGTD